MSSSLVFQRYPIDPEALPSGWRVTSLRELCEIAEPGFASGSHNRLGAGIPHLRPMNISTRGELDFSDMKFVNPSIDARRLLAGDVLFNNTNSPALIGKTAFVRRAGNFAFSNHMTRLRPRDEMVSAYLAYQLHYLWMSGYFRYRCVKHINQASISTAPLLDSVPIVVAPTIEQNRIVAEIEKHFSRLDAADAALARVKANLKRYRASILKAACEGRLVPTEAELARAVGRAYEPADQLLRRLLDKRRRDWEQPENRIREPRRRRSTNYPEPVLPEVSELPPLPGGWCWATLEQLTSAIRPICYGILMPKDHVADGVPYVKVRDMKSGRLDVTALSRTDPRIAEEYRRSTLCAGDLLLAIRGTYGRVVEVPPDLEGGNITQDTARLAVHAELDRDYLRAYLLSPLAQSFFKKVSRGVAVKGVNISDVRACPVALPPVTEQRSIALEVERRLSAMDHLAVEVRSSAVRSERLRKAILQSAFDGRLCNRDNGDGVAATTSNGAWMAVER